MSLSPQNELAKQSTEKPTPELSGTASECSWTDDQGSGDDEEVFHEAKPTSVPAPKPKTLTQMIVPRVWSLFTLSGLGALAPLVFAGTAVAVALNRLVSPRIKSVPSNGKVAIVTGGKMTKAYIMIKQLKAQGCRVILVETSKYWMVASRFSNCVDRFVTVPVPEKEPEAFLAAMGQLAKEEKADIFVPVTSPVASQYEARVGSVLPEGCHSWSLSPTDTDDLDDKVAFCASAERIGLSVPIARRMRSHADVHAFNTELHAIENREPTKKHPRYILKNLAYDSMHRLDLFTLPCAPEALEAYLSDILIDEANPWLVQTFVVGDEYSTCGLVKDGKLLVFTDNAASISCFNYLPARNHKLRQWVETFCAARRLSGIVCIDFIVDSDGTPYAIECNPRASSNLTNFYNNPALGSVLVNPDTSTGTVQPLPSAVETCWAFSEAWATVAKAPSLLSLPRRLLGLLHSLTFKKDAYFDAADPLPFLALNFIHIPTLLVRNLFTGNRWAKIDPCIGKLTEENGD